MFERSVRDVATKRQLLIYAHRNLINFYFDVQSRSGMRGIVFFRGLIFSFLCLLAVRAHECTFHPHYLLIFIGNSYNAVKVTFSGPVAQPMLKPYLIFLTHLYYCRLSPKRATNLHSCQICDELTTTAKSR